MDDAKPLLRPLLWPLRFTVALLILLGAVLIPILRLSILGWPGLVILGSFLSKYAYVLLESAAHGVVEPPTLSIEMVNPLEQRPLIQLCIGAVVAALVAWLPAPADSAVAVCAVLLLPASVGVLGVSSSALDAVNPLVLVRTGVELGPWYLAILGVIALYAALIYWAFTAPAWAVVSWALTLFCAFSLFTLVGTALHARRLRLGFEPSHSPERTAARARLAQRREIDRFLEELYRSVRLHDYAQAGERLEAWAALRGDEAVALAAPGVVQRALAWSDERGLALVASRLAARLLRKGRSGEALDLVAAALPHAPMLRLASDAEQFALAQAARADGRRALTAALLKRLEQDFPDSPFQERARALRAEIK